MGDFERARMAKMFRGRFSCKSDSKGRIALPAAYRKEKSSSTKLVITNSQTDSRRCLDVYTLKEWEKLEKRIASLPQLKREVQVFQRFYLSSGQLVETDKNQRFLVPQSLRQFAEVEEGVMLVGMGHKFEIWSEKAWVDLYENMAGDFESVLQQVADLEGGL